MNSYIVICANAIYEESQLVEIAESLYWIEANCALDAFDEATSKAISRADLCAHAFKDRRDFIGITEVLPVIDVPENGNIIGQRLYLGEEENEIKNWIMSREEFIQIEAERTKDATEQ